MSGKDVVLKWECSPFYGLVSVKVSLHTNAAPESEDVFFSGCRCKWSGGFVEAIFLLVRYLSLLNVSKPVEIYLYLRMESIPDCTFVDYDCMEQTR